MNQRQIDYGKQQLAHCAKEWGVTIEQAAIILDSTEQYYFLQWINAREFLEEELWREE